MRRCQKCDLTQELLLKCDLGARAEIWDKRDKIHSLGCRTAPGACSFSWRAGAK